MAKYARPRSLSGTADWACQDCFLSKTEGRHILPYSVYNLFITYFNTEFNFENLPIVIENIWNVQHFLRL